MFSQKSLRNRFILQLALASTMLIAIISVMLYYYIKVTILDSAVQELKLEAKNIISKVDEKNFNEISISKIHENKNINFKILPKALSRKKPYFILKDDILNLYYPFGNFNLVLSKNTSFQINLIEQILIDILIVNATAILLVLFYTLFLSRMLLVPIKTMANRLSKLNEKFLDEIDIEKLPEEFSPLGNSVNKLINRIQTFVLYQKELFIGAAHELKTPLAVMKTKNEVTLLKKRNDEKYIEALLANNEAIESMNKMISSMLEIGRQEGAQFEEPINVNLIEFIKDLANNYKILANKENKNIIIKLSPKNLNTKIQTSLLNHILGNFLQNAIKFSPENSNIEIVSKIEDKNFIVQICDEGIGIDESKDLFAPFKRFGDKGGTGLGLFLAKGAAQALGGNIFIKNNKNKNGAISTLILPLNKNNK